MQAMPGYFWPVGCRLCMPALKLPKINWWLLGNSSEVISLWIATKTRILLLAIYCDFELNDNVDQ